MSVRALVIGCFALVAAGMAILTGASLWSDHINRAYAARADMAYRQALLVTQLELAASDAAANGASARRALSQKAAEYLASIEEEARLLGPDETGEADQDAERASAQRLIDAIMANDAQGDLALVRSLAAAIAAREVREAAAARSEAEAVARQTRIMIIAAAGALLLVPLALLVLVQRLVLVPLGNLGAATRNLALDHRAVRPAPGGLLEIRTLTERFNAMADAVEARVAERTSELERANADLAAVDQRRRLFLAKVSHELRTPVTAIRGEAEVSLRHDGPQADRREALAQIEQTALFLQRRLDDLMVLAKADDAQLPLASGLVDPFTIARRAGAVAAAYARASEVEIVMRALPPQDAPPIAVCSDPDRLQQAFAAVLDNAIKFSPPGAAITITGQIDDGAATVMITDQGPGVGLTELAQIFDPYVQGDSGRALGGTGLGLSLARWIIEAYGGEISARSGCAKHEGAEGLCVIFRLPIAG
ncbi:MAG: sensor histidine kinase [Erythrobacter sp.]